MLYDPDASSTSKDQNQPFGISYGTGEAKGEYYSDVFAFGDPNGPQMKLKNPIVFGAGTDLSFTDEVENKSDIICKEFQGILGLPAFSNMNDMGTSTSIIVAPEKVVRVFAAVLGAQEYDGSYYVSCKKKFDFKLKIGGKIFTIPSEQLLMDNKDGYCELLLVSGDYGFWILGEADPKGNDTLLVQHDVYKQRMFSKRSVEYLGTVTLGNPPQTFQAILDTGSDIFWVPKVNCYSTGPYANNCRSGRSLYSPKRSKKSKRLGRPFSIHYGTGSASGGYYKDVFAAILGLPSTDTSSGRGNSIFHQAVRDGLMDKPIFTAYLRKCSQGSSCSRDTGTSDIIVSTEVANRIGRAIGAMNRYGGRYVRCGKEFNVKLRINGHSYLLPSKQLLLPAGNGYCRLGISGGAERMGVWILGDPFLRSFCNVHDIKRRRIGFAKVK
ncbi:Eukaryotic aspartyl protease [Aphelenchoides besseyi]|nr:Eukaryotic aspartyl protease [Aphelenchoides besseyi]